MVLCSNTGAEVRPRRSVGYALKALCLLAFLLCIFLPAQAGAEKPELKGVESTSKETGKAARKVPLVITSDSLEADNKKGIVIFRGNVIAEEEFLVCSDKLTLGLGAAEQVDKIVALGDVRILYDNKVAGAERAEYVSESRKLVLTGSAVVVECEDRIQGERIEVFLDEDRAVVDGGDSSAGGRVSAFIMPQKKCSEHDISAGTSEEAAKEATGVAGERESGNGSDGNGTDGESRCRWARQVLR